MCAKIYRGNHYLRSAYEISEIQHTYCVLWKQGSLTSIVKQELLEKMDMDLDAQQKIISYSPKSQATAARIYDSHVNCVSPAFFIQFFLDVNPFLPLFQSLNTWQEHDTVFCT